MGVGIRSTETRWPASQQGYFLAFLHFFLLSSTTCNNCINDQNTLTRPSVPNPQSYFHPSCNLIPSIPGENACQDSDNTQVTVITHVLTLTAIHSVIHSSSLVSVSCMHIRIKRLPDIISSLPPITDPPEMNPLCSTRGRARAQMPKEQLAPNHLNGLERGKQAAGRQKPSKPSSFPFSSFLFQESTMHSEPLGAAGETNQS